RSRSRSAPTPPRRAGASPTTTSPRSTGSSRCRPDRPECRVPSRCPAAEPASFTARLDRRGPAAGAASLFIGEPDLASPIDSPMDVTINERSPVDFELDIRATHDELEPRLHEALKEQRKKM